jgi:sec-independent protein translocase protein TatA
MFGSLGFGEILLILLAVLLLFGAKRIPEVMGSFGKGIRDFKRGMNDLGNTDITQPPERDRLRGGDAPTPTASGEESHPEPKRLIK